MIYCEEELPYTTMEALINWEYAAGDISEDEYEEQLAELYGLE